MSKCAGKKTFLAQVTSKLLKTSITNKCTTKMYVYKAAFALVMYFHAEMAASDMSMPLIL